MILNFNFFKIISRNISYEKNNLFYCNGVYFFMHWVQE